MSGRVAGGLVRAGRAGVQALGRVRVADPLTRLQDWGPTRRWCQAASAITMTIRSLATTIRVCGCKPNDRIRSVIIIFEMKPMSFASGRKLPGPGVFGANSPDSETAVLPCDTRAGAASSTAPRRC